jgi:prophage regulatory protein
MMSEQAVPSPRLLPPAVVSDRTSLSRTTLWRLVRRQEFPAPVHISDNRIAWPEAAVNAWIAAKMEAA